MRNEREPRTEREIIEAARGPKRKANSPTRWRARSTRRLLPVGSIRKPIDANGNPAPIRFVGIVDQPPLDRRRPKPAPLVFLPYRRATVAAMSAIAPFSGRRGPREAPAALAAAAAVLPECGAPRPGSPAAARHRSCWRKESATSGPPWAALRADAACTKIAGKPLTLRARGSCYRPITLVAP
jgi:hypothetical protein